jgi:hypothetical protein
MHTKEDIIRFVESDFCEMPGLRLTEAQARRLWSLDRAVCQDVLETLVERGFLTHTADGRYRRTIDDLEHRPAGRSRLHAGGGEPRAAA